MKPRGTALVRTIALPGGAILALSLAALSRFSDMFAGPLGGLTRQGKEALGPTAPLLEHTLSAFGMSALFGCFALIAELGRGAGRDRSPLIRPRWFPFVIAAITFSCGLAWELEQAYGMLAAQRPSTGLQVDQLLSDGVGCLAYVLLSIWADRGPARLYR